VADGPPRLRVVGDDVYPDWETIYRDNVDRVYRLMFAKVGNRPDAEDLTEEVFLAALRPLRMSASVGEVRAYLLAVARTVLAGYWRRTLGRPVTTLDDERVEDVFEPAQPSRTASAWAEQILRALPPRYRQVLELRFLRAYTVKETAAELGISVGNAKVLQHRALRQAAVVAREVKP
jgi:RNA polymerase sigma-70 factor (ECF subfamily)